MSERQEHMAEVYQRIFGQFCDRVLKEEARDGSTRRKHDQAAERTGEERMERLTFDGKFCDIAQCRETPGGSFCENGTCSQKEVWLRLKGYEDTGLTPEQCAEYAKADREGRYIVLRDAEQEGVKRLRELAKADKEGRLVVLPCKVGDTAWVKDRAGVPREMRLESPDIRFVCTDEDNLCMSTCNRTGNGLCAYRIRNDGTDIGKRIFPTREEAEAALKEAQNGNKTDM